MSIILVRYAEIGLKSTPVRVQFENRLKENMLSMMAADGIEALVTKGEARFYVEATDLDLAVKSLRKVFGIASLSIADVCSADLEDICATAANYSKGRMTPNMTFAVRARREGNHHPFTSVDVGREAGSAIFVENEDLPVKVDLTNPDKIFYVEVRNNKTYIFDSYIRCHAGLPIGTQGRVIAEVDDDRGFLSAWLMMKRGCKVYVKGDYRLDDLKEYDPALRDLNECLNDPRKTMGYVLGTSLKELEEVDVSQYDVPVFFPTIGMRDEQVSSMMAEINSIINN